MTALCFPGTPGRPHRLVSSSDEKILRVFDAPSSFLRLLQGVDSLTPGWPGDTVERVEQAYVPELGLSNKVGCATFRWGRVLWTLCGLRKGCACGVAGGGGRSSLVAVARPGGRFALH
jgi:hypothetical protein